ncbi:mucin-22-like [Penaeus vannamei]|uniref:mucin-22-like n=1 Tax=Penaeus vannamei TaxID=6689 RepID=UPI00387F6E66
MASPTYALRLMKKSHTPGRLMLYSKYEIDSKIFAWLGAGRRVTRTHATLGIPASKYNPILPRVSGGAIRGQQRLTQAASDSDSHPYRLVVAVFETLIITKDVFETLTTTKAVFETLTTAQAAFETLTRIQAVFEALTIPQTVFETLTIPQTVFETLTETQAVFETLTAMQAVFETLATTQTVFETLITTQSVFEDLTIPQTVFETLTRKGEGNPAFLVGQKAISPIKDRNENSTTQAKALSHGTCYVNRKKIKTNKYFMTGDKLTG